MVPTQGRDMPNNLRPLNRYITTHDTSGKAVLSSDLPEAATEWQRLPAAAMFMAYTTPTFPATIANDSDIQNYGNLIHDPPGLFFPSSTICRVVDIAPGDTSPMHRTVSLDYGIVIDGEVELILESLDNPTARRIMGRGDVCVQRATIHAWRNTSQTDWARMVFVLTDCEKPIINGHELGENMDGVHDDALRNVLRSG